jgi:hypothetical protein
MPSTLYPETKFLVGPNDAREHAVLGALQHAAASLPGTEAWAAARIASEPQVIHDLNGQPLFLDFPLVSNDGEVGYARAAASRVVGAPVLSVELGARHWSFPAAVRKLTPQVKKAHPGARIAAPKLVCYSYPKLGVMFELTDESGGSSRAIFDVASLDPVREGDPAKTEGAVAWSYYDTIPDEVRASRIKRYDALDKTRLALPAAERRRLFADRVLKANIDILQPLIIKLTITKTLAYCEHYAMTHARGHHCFALKAQQVNDYCAGATAQMVLCYYRYDFPQDTIAPALGYSTGGGCPADQSPGYKSLSYNHLNASYDPEATWEKARDQIDARQPFKSGVPGHARACAGYSSLRTIKLASGGLGSTRSDEKLYIYDPWPWNADFALGGALYWEDWSSITHTNYVTTSIKTS